MKATIRAALLACSPLLLGGCLDEGGYEHYAPLGTGFAGSALGWTERKAGPGQYDLTYHHNYSAQADQKIRRRAAELCTAEGFRGALMDVQFRTDGDLVVASGRARCSNDRTRLAAQKSDAAAMNSAELGAVQQKQATMNAALGTFGGIGGLQGSPLATATAIMAQHETDRLSAQENTLSANLGALGGGAAGDGGVDGGGVDGGGLGPCERTPKCAAATQSFQGYRNRVLARGQPVSVHGSAVQAWCAGKAGIAVMDICLPEARAAGNTVCVNDYERAKADTQRMMQEARATANQSYAYAADGWMASCAK